MYIHTYTHTLQNNSLPLTCLWASCPHFWQEIWWLQISDRRYTCSVNMQQTDMLQVLVPASMYVYMCIHETHLCIYLCACKQHTSLSLYMQQRQTCCRFLFLRVCMYSFAYFAWCMAAYFLKLNMYVCMFVCLYVCMFVCMAAYFAPLPSSSICMYVCLYVCMYVCMYAHTHTHTCKPTSLCTLCSSSSLPASLICMYVCMYVCMCTHIHTHTHTHMQTHLSLHALQQQFLSCKLNKVLHKIHCPHLAR